MKLYNSLTNTVETFIPINNNIPRLYSCGPTVYDHVHIGNLSAFIIADTLRRALASRFDKVQHVMNLTDVDDKTIKKAALEYPNLRPNDALAASTAHYSDIFFDDMRAVGNAIEDIQFIRATDQQTIDDMQALILKMYNAGIAYIADDGVYFSIDAYRKTGKNYGQLVEITQASTSQARIHNDEYDKDSAHDFALWKLAKPGEPSWQFSLDGHDLTGRPGWHIECSAMSTRALGQPFDIHTGGIDLKFPHHENEIAQSTACEADPVYAAFFVHNDHILVNGRKMSKSLNNFYTLEDLVQQGVDPLAFRLLVLQSHYRSATNFSFENAASATNRLNHWREIAELRWQLPRTHVASDEGSVKLRPVPALLRDILDDDLNTPAVLVKVDEVFKSIENHTLEATHHATFMLVLEALDELLGLQLLSSTPDITDEQKQRIIERQRAREEKNWTLSDEIRDELLEQGIKLRDADNRAIWNRVR